jgi:LDH2 family malate/lactate/ureidoglycolate dehydrogenase
MVLLDSVKLAERMHITLVQLEIDPVAINHVVASLVMTSLRGVDSHGINLFPHYCRAVQGGRINRSPQMRFDQTAASTAILDADHAFGHHAGAVAMDHAVEVARSTGMASVAVRNSTHFGAAAYFSLRAAEQDCIGFAFCNADALVKAHNSRESFFGTNPICFAAPMANEGPFSLDMATSLAAWNKVGNARRTGKPIPPNWAFDDNGLSVTNANLACSLAPLGGYKGFDLGMMVDILCALLAGGPISKDIPPMYGAPLSTRRNITHFFMAIDIARFSEPMVFKAALQSMANRIRSLPLADSADDIVMVAGDPEKRSYEKRSREGIPIDDEKFAEYLELSADFNKALMQ